MQIDLISLVDNRNKTEKLRFFLLFFLKKKKKLLLLIYLTQRQKKVADTKTREDVNWHFKGKMHKWQVK